MKGLPGTKGGTGVMKKPYVNHWREILSFVVFLVLFLYECHRSFGHAFYDSEMYAMVLKVFRGEAAWLDVVPPFAWRPFVPLLALPVSYYVGSLYVALSIISIVGAVLWLTVFYLLMREFTDDYFLILALLVVAIAGTWADVFLASALCDSWQLFFITAIMYCAKTNRPDYYAYSLGAIGILTKETVVFGLFFYLLWKRDVWKKTAVVGCLIGMFYLLFRFLLMGTILQYMPFRLTMILEDPDAVFRAIYFSLAAPSILLFASVLRGISRDGRNWLVLGLLSMLPITYLGLFHAYFDLRFLLPIWIPLFPAIVDNPREEIVR